MSKSRWFVLASLVLLASLGFPTRSFAGTPVERLNNGSFEEGFAPTGVALGWTAFTDPGDHTIRFADDPAVALEGRHSQSIEFSAKPPRQPAGDNGAPTWQAGEAGLYQTVSTVQGTPYTLNLHALFRTDASDPLLGAGLYIAQWAVDLEGGTDWRKVADWQTLPWFSTNLKNTGGVFLAHTATVTATSNRATIFVRVLKPTARNSAGLIVQLDKLSFAGALPDTDNPPQMRIDAPNYPIENYPYTLRVTAFDEAGVSSISIFENDVLIGKREHAVGPLSSVLEVPWVPQGLGLHTLRFVTTDATARAITERRYVQVGNTAEFLQNGDFEEGFAENGVALKWGAFERHVTRYQYSYTKPGGTVPTVSGKFTQTIRIQVTDPSNTPRATYAGICQTLTNVRAGAQYWITLNAMVRSFDTYALKDAWKRSVQWSLAPGALPDCGLGDGLVVWETIPLTQLGFADVPQTYENYSAEFIAPANAMTIFLRFGIPDAAGAFDAELNVDAISIKGYR